MQTEVLHGARHLGTKDFVVLKDKGLVSLTVKCCALYNYGESVLLNPCYLNWL